VKVAISLPDELFVAADVAASQLSISRSQLYARALEQFLADRGSDPVTEKLDELADETRGNAGADAGRRLIETGMWTW